MVEKRLGIGDVCFLKLDGFSPAWRQAVVVQSNLRGAELFLACRVLEKETEDLEAEFSVFDFNGSSFLLVEGKPGQTRVSFTGVHRALELDPQLIVRRSKTILEGADPESEEEEDDVMDLLMKAQKMGREKAISTASARGVTEMKASRYPMLDKKKEEKDLSAAGLDRLLNQAVASGSNSLPMGDGNLNALITLELSKC